MSDLTGINSATPAGSDPASSGDDKIRELAAGTVGAVGKEHYLSGEHKFQYGNSYSGTPQDGQVWFDTTNGELKQYRTNAWVTVTANGNLTTHKNVATIDHPNNSVTTAKLADGCVTGAKIAAQTITGDKFAYSGTASMDISALVNHGNADALHTHAAGSVSSGAAYMKIGSTMIQWGQVYVGDIADTKNVDVTFPLLFTAPPLAVATMFANGSIYNRHNYAQINTVSASGMQLVCTETSGDVNTVYANWMAMGI